jgi:hypothetical protein
MANCPTLLKRKKTLEDKKAILDNSKGKVERTIGAINIKIAEAQKCPNTDKVAELETKRKLIEANLKALTHLLATQLGHEENFLAQLGQK